jgi:hypothetical protein
MSALGKGTVGFTFQRLNRTVRIFLTRVGVGGGEARPTAKKMRESFGSINVLDLALKVCVSHYK